MSDKFKKIASWGGTGWKIVLFDNSYIYQGMPTKAFKMKFYASYKDKQDEWKETPFIKANGSILKAIYDTIPEINEKIEMLMSGQTIHDESSKFKTDAEPSSLTLDDVLDDEDIPF